MKNLIFKNLTTNHTNNHEPAIRYLNLKFKEYLLAIRDLLGLRIRVLARVRVVGGKRILHLIRRSYG